MLKVFTFLFISILAQASEVHQAGKLRDHLGLDRFGSGVKASALKIAILDNGFSGFQTKDLPESTELVSQYEYDVQGNNLGTSNHGLYLAQIVWAITGKQSVGPKIYLLNANGMTSFRNAVRFAMEKKVDVILYAQNWEFGGNFDGKGFINAVVNQATSSGILWVNAAGNYGGNVYTGKIKTLADGVVQLPGTADCVRFENMYDKNQVRVTASWNDFADTEDYQTDKDLALSVYAMRDNSLVGTADLAQKSQGPTDTRKPSQHARERAELQLDRGLYCVRLTNNSKNFGAEDKVRIVVQTTNKPDDAIKMQDASFAGEIMIPADNPSVITVGADSPQSSKGPTADGRLKPDLVIDRVEVKFTDGLISSGSSNAAALFAGVALLAKGQNPKLDRAALIEVGKTLPGISGSEPTLKNALQKNCELDPQDILSTANVFGREVMTLKRHPLSLGTCFVNANQTLNTTGASGQALRYFVSISQGFQTYYWWKSVPLNLPNDSVNKWVELIY